MAKGLARFFSVDDLWSLLGFALLVGLTQINTPRMALPLASLFASGMLAIFWLASDRVRSRSPKPDLRIAFWAAIAVGSGLVLWLG